MRGLRSFLVLLVVAAGLGTYVYLVEVKREPASDADTREKVFSVESNKIDEIAIKGEAGERTLLRKSGENWQVVQPVTAAADSGEVAGITSNLTTLQVQRVIDENATDLKEFGLDPPRVEVTFKSGGQDQRLSIGQKTPPGTDLYARVGDQKKVFLIPSYLDATFNRTTFDLRDKSALKVDRDKIDVVEFTAGSQTTRIARADTEWELTAPWKARADFSTVEGLVSRLSTLQMKSIADGAADHGLDAPAATVRVGAGSAQASLAIGKPAAEGTVYARDLSREVTFTIESALLDDLKKAPGEYRQKDLFDARAFNTTRLELTRNGQTQVFEKAQDKWRQSAPAAKDVDSAKMEALLSSLTGARATDFVDNAPKGTLEKPEVTAVVKFDEGKKEDRVTFARGKDVAYAVRAGTQGVARTGIGVLDAIVKALEDLK